jgi:hypothetical protein
MNLRQLLAVAIFFSVTSLSAVQAQTQRPGEAVRTQELVDHLKEVIRGAEQDRRSNLSVVRQLKDLVRRYDRPWGVSLLFDDFRDGNYTRDPRWRVTQGDFSVVRGTGLRSYFDAPAGTYRTSDRRSDSPAFDILSEILIGKREPDVEAPVSATSQAEIFTSVGISNAFALKLQLSLRDRNTRVEFGPFQGEAREYGYRLAYVSGRAPSLSLLRVGPSRSAVIEMVDQAIVLDDGSPHTIEWRRSNDGEMVILLDSKEVIRTVDRAYDDPFDGFTIINKGGEFDVRQISIFGTPQ